MCTDLMNVNDWNDWIWIHTLQGPLLVIFTSTLKLQIQNVHISPQWHHAYWQQGHGTLSTFLDPNTQKVQKITKMPAVILLLFFSFFFFLQKQSFAFRCYSMCRRIKGIPAVFKQIPVSRFKCTNLWEPNSFISEMFFLSFLVHCRQNEDVSANQECIQIIFLHQGNPSKLLSFRGPTGILESLLPV